VGRHRDPSEPRDVMSELFQNPDFSRLATRTAEALSSFIARTIVHDRQTALIHEVAVSRQFPFVSTSI